MALAGCHKSGASAVTKAGRRPRRIVSTVPAATQILLQIGAGHAIAAVSSYDEPLLHGQYRKLPVIGNYLRLNTELMIDLHPTALVLQIQPSLIPQSIRHLTQKLRCRIIDIRLNSIADLAQTTRELGAAAGCSTSAALAVARLARGVKHAQQAFAVHPPVTVVYCISANPLRIVGGDNFMNDEVQLAGGQNLGNTLGAGFPRISHGQLLELNPEKILIWHPGKVFHGPYRWLQAHFPGRLCRIPWPDADLLTLGVVRKIRRIHQMLNPQPKMADTQTTPAHLPARRLP